MSGPLGGELLAAVLTGVAVAALSAAVVRPTPRLARRVRPYTAATRSALGHAADVLAVVEAGPALSGSTLRRLLGPMVERPARALAAVVERTGEETLRLRLRQAGLFADVSESRRAQEYRVRQLASTVTFAAAGCGTALALGRSPAVVLLATLGGAAFGATRWRGRVDRAIEDRRLMIRTELYTINQLLAMNVRCGSGVAQAMQRVVERGSGAVVGELGEVLAAHRGGRRVSEALERAARLTPEPHAGRTYKLLANGVEYGADLADGLRALSEDIRNERSEELKRAATRRRAAMLLPIIAILAPIMLLFLAAPLPSIVFGGG